MAHTKEAYLFFQTLCVSYDKKDLKIYIPITPAGQNQHIPDEIISTCMMRSRLREIRGCIPDVKDHKKKCGEGGVKAFQVGAKKHFRDNFIEHLLVNNIIIAPLFWCFTRWVSLCQIVVQSESHSRSLKSHSSNWEPELLCKRQRGHRCKCSTGEDDI